MPRFWSWNSCEFSIAPVGEPAKILTEINSVSYSDAVESELVRGAGRDPLGTTDPVYVPGDASIEFLSKFFRTWAYEITNQGEIRLGELDFILIVKRRSRTDAEAIVDEIKLQMLGAEDSQTAGEAGRLLTPISCLPLEIKRNGVRF
jgi:hypothetical protein